MIGKAIEFIKDNKLAVLLAVSVSGSVFGFIPNMSQLYYLALFVWALCAVKWAEKVSSKFTIFVIVCGLSILLNNPDPIFQPWSRLLLFTLLIASVTPWIESERIHQCRVVFFNILLWFVGIVSVSAPFCYVLGINFMKRYGMETPYLDRVGWFGGLTSHSMLLGPLCALGCGMFTYLACLAEDKRSRYLSIFAIVASICGCFASASRSASASAMAGVIFIFFLCNRGSFSKLLSRLIGLVLLIVVCFPIYQPFLHGVSEKQQNQTNGTFSSREILWQHRVQEYESNPVFGVGFSSMDTNISSEYNRVSGTVEPGSSWLAILSMTGLCGLVCFLSILVPIMFRLWKSEIPVANLYLGLLFIFSIHFISEGYVFAAGTFLCVFFWLTLGVSVNVDLYSKYEEE